VKGVEKPNFVSTEIKLFLDEFKEIIANDLPKGLSLGEKYFSSN
jgi:hypothetical protein